ncbi:hypothetical protein SAMN05216593_1344 [Pseudomonas asturiensis]|uniref:Uncharacterized protein n=1 Tax=Pseudomonas asturiensis TaxID=1190415 RepID=A0A1M7QK39_9PSED|nr:hypothetical protein SAMN05216593_1344 [Pseudomonas asturiensis]
MIERSDDACSLVKNLRISEKIRQFASVNPQTRSKGVNEA